jgi:MFS family permease
MAQFMVVLDISIVNVALPSIKTDLHFSQESLQWVITAYAIFFGGFLLLGGRLADLLGRRRLFMAGLLVFTISSLLNGLAWSEGSLIVFRSLQGLGAAMMSPAALSILTTTFQEGRERNRALGIWGAVAGSGGGQRWRRGRAAWWCVDQRVQLAMDLLRQRAYRCSRDRGEPLAHP